jgi:hypothetical protein
MALSATQVIKTYDYYNTLTLLPGYVMPGYEDEQNITRAHYSTDFSSNPLGSKVDFFVHLNDPCKSITDPNPVFTVPKSLSALDPQWFDGYWDHAMFYSHPLVTAQLTALHPDIYQSFSDSVGTLAYVPPDYNPDNPEVYGRASVNSSLSHKIPVNLFNAMDSLNNDVFKLYDKFTPNNLGLTKNSFLKQVFALQDSSNTLQLGLKTRFGSLKVKLPFDTNITGNMFNPQEWAHKNIIEGINTNVDKLNNFLKNNSPGKLLSEGLIKLKSLLPKINLPSISKLLGINVPNMPAISNAIKQIQNFGNAVKSVVSEAQGVISAVKETAGAIQEGIGTIAGTINSETNEIKNIVNTVKRLPSSVQGLESIVNVGGTNVGLSYQTPNAPTGLDKNSVVIIPGNTINSQGNTSVVKVITNQFPPSS